MLSEFTNKTSFSHRKVYSGTANIENNTYCETKFFQDKYSVFNLVSLFFDNNELEQDFAIKRFINYIYSSYDENKDNIMFQNDFLKINKDFLENIIEIDDYTKTYMKDKKYPCVLSKEKDDYNGCSFVKNYPYHPYIFYKFKKMSVQELNNIVSDYLHEFFNNIENENDIILDQLFSSKSFLLEVMNFYMHDNPIKEICVYRDPRDEYVNLWRDHIINFNEIEPEEFINYYIKNCAKKISQSSPNRLIVRFEDMIMDYDKTTEKIIKILGFDEKQHIYKKQIFIPEKSKVNIGEYKEFHDQSIINNIEQNLKEYI